MDEPDDAAWWAAFQQKFDAAEALKFWALEYYLGDSDNYVTFTNNYFLVSSGTGVFSYLPWGTDKTFTVPSNDPASLAPTWSHSAVVNRCFNYEPCGAAYRAALTDVAETILSMDLVDTAHQLYRATAAHVEADQRKETTTLYSCQAVNSTISFLVGRATLWENSFRSPESGVSTVQTSTPLDCAFLSNDHTAPVVTVGAPTNNSSVNTPNVTLMYEASDETGVAPACTPERGSIVALNPGENQISVECTDANANRATVSTNVTLDTTPPEVAITAPSDGDATNANSMSLHFTKNDDFDVEPACDKADGDTVSLDPGSNTIEVHCTDEAGNVGSDLVTVTSDIDPPVIKDISPATGLATTDASLVLTYDATDNSGGTPSCTPASGSRVDLAVGLNTISIQCTDAVGNTGSVSVVYTRVGDRPETVPTVAAAPAAVSIDRGKKYTHRFGVQLKLTWPLGVTRARISNYKNLHKLRTIAAPKRWVSWRLPRRGGLRGARKVYVEFVDRDGAVVARASDTIRLSCRYH